MALQLDPEKSLVIEKAFRDFLATCDYEPGQVLLDYTLMLHAAWKPVLTMLPIGPGMRLLDAGCGYGLLADELAANLPLAVSGVDIDPRYVEGARALAERLGESSIFTPGSEPRFEEGDLCALPFEDSSFEFTMVREVHQFVPEPEAATREIFRVTVPSGFACVSDNDDGFYLTYPDPTPAFNELWAAVQAEQSSYGGDRTVGRKLSTYMKQAGFDILAVTVIPEARHYTSGADDPESRFLVEQAREAQPRLVKAGVITAERLQDLIAELDSEPVTDRFRFNARVVVVGRRPS